MNRVPQRSTLDSTVAMNCSGDACELYRSVLYSTAYTALMAGRQAWTASASMAVDMDVDVDMMYGEENIFRERGKKFGTRCSQTGVRPGGAVAGLRHGCGPVTAPYAARLRHDVPRLRTG